MAYLILVTNDDGIDAVGIKRLAEAMLPLGNVMIVAPTVQRSGESKSLTFSRPLRVAEINDKFTMKAYSVDGTPADTVLLGKYLCNKNFSKDPDLIVSGINSGDNTSVHALLTSGTCAAAFEGALLGIPSISFSLVVKSTELFFGSNSTADYTNAARRAGEIVDYVLTNPLPEGIKFLNVNFPANCVDSPIEVVKLAPEKYKNDIIEATDPRGVPVYWIWGNSVPNLETGTDSHALRYNNAITITPISLGFGRWALPKIGKYFQNLNVNVKE
ncbi:MAG: 5'/3'-nucleotidase SurE [Candidatus Hodarchaeales archaeon]|jgi:5'-nucleotidase